MGPALAIVAVGSMIASAASSAMSAYSQEQSAQYNAQVAKNNQIIANQNAATTLEEGQQQEENQRLKTGAVVAQIGAQEAASGVNPNEGSALNVKSSEAEMGELDAQTIRWKSNLQAQNLKYQGSMYGAQASLDESQGQWGMASSLLGGASSVSSKWLSYQQAGVSGFGSPSGNPFGI
jgi:hypothetical protein